VLAEAMLMKTDMMKVRCNGAQIFRSSMRLFSLMNVIMSLREHGTSFLLDPVSS
jgi:hypothetical protein